MGGVRAGGAARGPRALAAAERARGRLVGGPAERLSPRERVRALRANLSLSRRSEATPYAVIVAAPNLAYLERTDRDPLERAVARFDASRLFPPGLGDDGAGIA
jgi:hypothetical protein